MEAERHSLQVRNPSEATIKMILIANRQAGAEVLLSGAAKGGKPHPHVSESGHGLFIDQV